MESTGRMIGVSNRLPGVVCEIGTCNFTATFMEDINVIPGDPGLRHERHRPDIALCGIHERKFRQTGLVGTITASGDRIS